MVSYIIINNNLKKHMKKIMIIIVSLLITTSFAEYNIMIGKGMPTESIKFVNKTPPVPELPPEPPKPSCQYGYPSNYWLNGRNTSYAIVHVVDNNVKVYDGKDIYTTVHIIGNFKYTRGDFIGNFGDYSRYNICKVSI